MVRPHGDRRGRDTLNATAHRRLVPVPNVWRRAWILGACVAAGVAIFFGTQFGSQGAAPLRVTVSGGPTAVGSPAPDFSTQTLDGGSVRLGDLRGKPVLLNFWATWCSACEAEMPAIQRAAGRYQRRGLTVLAVNYRQTDVAQMRTFLKRIGARFPAVFDPEGRIAAAYGVSYGLPISVFIARSGTVLFIQVGQMSSTLLDGKLRSIL